MSVDPKQLERLRHFFLLVEKYLDGQLPDAQRDQLRDMLQADEDLQRRFVEWTTMDVTLRGTMKTVGAGSQETEDLVEVSVGQSFEEAESSDTMANLALVGIDRTSRSLDARKPGRSSPWVTGLAAAAMLAMAVGLLLYLGTDKTPPTQVPLEGAVAKIRQSLDAVWANRTLGQGHAMAPGAYRLRQGVVELETNRGARLIIEAPARFDLVSEQLSILRSGKLNAVVPISATGYTVQTPSTKVVDIGTRFGVEVEPHGRTVVNVFQGKVHYSAKNIEAETLNAGKGIAVARNGEAEDVEVDAAAFLQAKQLNQMAAYRHALIADESVVLYYDMGDTSGGIVRNLASASPRQNLATHGNISGASLVSGRSPGRHAIRFSRISDHVAFSVPGELDGLTMAMWVQVEQYHRGLTGFLQTDGWHPEKSGNLHWRTDGRSGNLHFGVVQDGIYHNRSVAQSKLSIGEWVHLAVTYDPWHQMRFFKNGRLLSEFKLTGKPQFPVDRPGFWIGQGRIGNWGNPVRGDKDFAQRRLVGKIDELVIFNRPLAPLAVFDLYESGQQQTTTGLGNKP